MSVHSILEDLSGCKRKGAKKWGTGERSNSYNFRVVRVGQFQKVTFKT